MNFILIILMFIFFAFNFRWKKCWSNSVSNKYEKLNIFCFSTVLPRLETRDSQTVFAVYPRPPRKPVQSICSQYLFILLAEKGK